MAKRLEGKRVVITGASTGIGREIAIGFGTEGAKVIINFHSSAEAKDAQAVVGKLGTNVAFAIRADIALAKDVNKLVQRSLDFLGGVDVLVNNAGICPWSPFIELPISLWERTQAVNHRGTFLCSQAFAKRMVEQGTGGSIITIGSVGAYHGGHYQAHYNASKAAAGSLMRSMAVELGSFNIRCNTILPGCIETNINRNVLSRAEERTTMVNRTPLHRLGTPADVVGAAIFFASDESSFCTGSELRVDGGISVNV